MTNQLGCHVTSIKSTSISSIFLQTYAHFAHNFTFIRMINKKLYSRLNSLLLYINIEHDVFNLFIGLSYWEVRRYQLNIRSISNIRKLVQYAAKEHEWCSFFFDEFDFIYHSSWPRWKNDLKFNCRHVSFFNLLLHYIYTISE